MRTWERVAGILAFASIVAANVWYTNYAIEGSERRQCEVFAIELDFYRESPPDNELRQRRYEIYQREWDKHCVP